MSVPSADRRRLEHILDSIERIRSYTASGRVAFDTDQMVQDAVVRCLTVIGEAASALTPETYKRLASLPAHLPKAQRNLLIHEYWRVDADLVWATVLHDLPDLERDVRAVLGE